MYQLVKNELVNFDSRPTNSHQRISKSHWAKGLG